MTDERPTNPDWSDAPGAIAPGASDKSAEERASRVEAAEAGLHHEAAEQAAGRPPSEHVTATDVVSAHPHHHPDDPNAGVLRARTGPHAALAGLLAAAVTVAGVVLLALAIGAR